MNPAPPLPPASPVSALLPFSWGDGALLLGALIGLFLCYFGYRFVMISMGILGFAIGAAFGGFFGILSVRLLEDPPQHETLAMLALGAILGLTGSLGSLALLTVGLFILGLTLGLGAVIVACKLLGAPVTGIVMLAGALGGGLLGVLLKRTFIVLGTALFGSTLTVLSLLSLLTRQSVGELPALATAWRNRLAQFLASPSASTFPTREEAALLIAISVILLGGIISQRRLPEPAVVKPPPPPAKKPG